jgi:hypothetical protein
VADGCCWREERRERVEEGGEQVVPEETPCHPPWSSPEEVRDFLLVVFFKEEARQATSGKVPTPREDLLRSPIPAHSDFHERFCKGFLSSELPRVNSPVYETECQHRITVP